MLELSEEDRTRREAPDTSRTRTHIPEKKQMPQEIDRATRTEGQGGGTVKRVSKDTSYSRHEWETR